MTTKRHERLSEALCEAVEFGHPTCIRIGTTAWYGLLASINAEVGWKMDPSFKKYEDVPIQIEHGFNGCVVEHDNRYVGLLTEGPAKAIPESVAIMNDTLKPAIVAWTDDA